VEAAIASHGDAFDSGFVAEKPDRLRRLPQYYSAMLGAEPFPAPSCDAPWVSAVVEANGDVRPCFFHPPIGNLRKTAIQEIVRDHLRDFRADLDVSADERCGRCVCALNVNWRQPPWN
jgi:MoaA/NifB/PqqE/SkfB family radical SAM enzyme